MNGQHPQNDEDADGFLENMNFLCCPGGLVSNPLDYVMLLGWLYCPLLISLLCFDSMILS